MTDEEFIQMIVSERLAMLLNKKADPEEAEALDRAEGILKGLGEYERETVEGYISCLISSEAQAQEQAYREGVRDGILLIKEIGRAGRGLCCKNQRRKGE